MPVALVLVGLTILSGMRAAQANSACALCGTGDWHVLVGSQLLDVYAYGGLAAVWLPIALVLM